MRRPASLSVANWTGRSNPGARTNPLTQGFTPRTPQHRMRNTPPGTRPGSRTPGLPEPSPTLLPATGPAARTAGCSNSTGTAPLIRTPPWQLSRTKSRAVARTAANPTPRPQTTPHPRKTGPHNHPTPTPKHPRREATTPGGYVTLLGLGGCGVQPGRRFAGSPWSVAVSAGGLWCSSAVRRGGRWVVRSTRSLHTRGVSPELVACRCVGVACSPWRGSRVEGGPGGPVPPAARSGLLRLPGCAGFTPAHRPGPLACGSSAAAVSPPPSAQGAPLG